MPGISLDSVSNMSPEFQKAYSAALTAERKPIQRLEENKEKITSKVNLLNDLNSKVEALKKSLPEVGSPFAIRDLSFTSDDEKVITGSADKSVADKGKHSIEVLQLADSASALSNNLPDKNETTVGTGYITFKQKNGDVQEIFIDEDSSTLEGVAKAINSAKTGLKATVVNDNAGEEPAFRLLLKADGIGTQNDVEFPEFYLSGGESDFFLDSERDAANAIIKYQGFEIQSPTNELKDIIPGATVNLKGLTEMNKPLTITIEQDIPKTTAKVKDVVEKLNQVFSFIQSQNTMDEKTDTSRTLGGDYGIRLAQDRLRVALQQNFLNDASRKYKSLSDIGVQFDKKGTLTFDEKKFQSALENNYDEVTSLITGDGQTTGIMPAVLSAANSISSAGRGVITNQLENYNGQVRGIDKSIADKEKQFEAKAEALKNQLAAAQSAITAMKSQTGYFQGGGGGIPQ